MIAMLNGAILGDIVGSPYEFDRGNKTKDFPLFTERSHYTDDTVMTLAIAQALLDLPEDVSNVSDETIMDRFAYRMREFGRLYPHAGYGSSFHRWLFNSKMGPYNSYGNGSAMRVSAVGWFYDDMWTVRRVARLSAAVTHNHPEGIKGAEAVASTIHLARAHRPKKQIKAYIEREFGYDLSRTCNQIRPNYHHVESCMETVPEAITAFLEGSDLEDVVRTAVSLGGDCDTVAAIAGSIAEAYDGVIYDKIVCEIMHRLPEHLNRVLNDVDLYFIQKAERNHRIIVQGGLPLL
ncbi:MAG: ADP-ribosylglycohydrolase family protein [Clostridia bacterium]|nr:ADP-ribosylglycohydrolase family protein [Clostridia bacterium]